MVRELRWACLGAALCLTSPLVYAKDFELPSAWRQAEVKIDGVADEWAGVLRPLPDVPMLIGVQNDGDFLYLCFKTSDPKTKRQLAMLGLTVWADGAGKKEKTFGVRFPVAGGARFARPTRDGSSAPPSDTHPAPSPGGAGGEFEIIGPTAGDRLIVPPDDAHPIRAAIGDESGVMVIEMRIPLKPSEMHPLSVGSTPGRTVLLGLETERRSSKQAEGGEGGGERRGGGGYGGRGGYGGSRPGGPGSGGRGGGMGGGMRGERGQMPDPIKLWLDVKLATQPPAPAAGS
jgi:hypothetical protein